MATEDGDLHKVQKILASGTHPDSQRGKRGSTALFVAVNHHQHAIIQALLEAGANPDLVCGSTTPLEFSIWIGDLTAFTRLREKSKLPRSVGGMTLLQCACSSNASDHDETTIDKMVLNLLQSGQNPNEPLPDGESCLNQAIERGRYLVVLALVQNGADPSLPDKKHGTPIEFAKNQINFYQNALIRDRGLLEKLNSGDKGIFDAEFLQASINSDQQKISTFEKILAALTQYRPPATVANPGLRLSA